MTKYESWMLAASWFTAVGTLGAVVFAMFSAALKRWVNSPKLTFHISEAIPNCNLVSGCNPQVGNRSFDFIEGCGYVQNSKRYCAKSCQVMCDEIFVLDADGRKFCQFKKIRPRQFPWVDAEEGAHIPIDIPQSLHRYVKVFEIKNVKEIPSAPFGPVASHSQNATQIVVCLMIGKDYIRIPSEYRSIILPIVITSSGMKPINEYIRVDWKGGSVKEISDPGKLKVSKLFEKDFREITNMKKEG